MQIQCQLLFLLSFSICKTTAKKNESKILCLFILFFGLFFRFVFVSSNVIYSWSCCTCSMKLHSIYSLFMKCLFCVHIMCPHTVSFFVYTFCVVLVLLFSFFIENHKCNNKSINVEYKMSTWAKLHLLYTLVSNALKPQIEKKTQSWQQLNITKHAQNTFIFQLCFVFIWSKVKSICWLCTCVCVLCDIAYFFLSIFHVILLSLSFIYLSFL